MRNVFVVLAGIILVVIGYFVFVNGGEGDVVIYVSHDQDYSEPIINRCEKELGISVKSVYDTEANKTVGLANRLISEKDNPQADVFWNNEVIRSVQLKNEDVLQPYEPIHGSDIPSTYKDDEYYWTGFAARLRILLVNTEMLDPSMYPNSIFNLLSSSYSESVAMANPLFGTTGTHLASWYSVLGAEDTENYLSQLSDLGLTIAESNGQVRDLVADGELPIGFTDTDDANDAIMDGKPVEIIIPDQDEGSIGTLVIPNTIMLIKGSPHEENGKDLINCILSPETEAELAQSKYAQLPLLPNVEGPSILPDIYEINAMEVIWGDVAIQLENMQSYVEDVLLSGK